MINSYYYILYDLNKHYIQQFIAKYVFMAITHLNYIKNYIYNFYML